MQALLYVQINFFALFVVLLILFRVHQFRLEMRTDHKLFVLMCFSLVLMLILDTAMWVVDGKPGDINLELNRAASVLCYSFNMLPILSWALFVDYMIYKSEKRIRKLTVPFLILLGFNTLLSVWSLFENILFHIDSLNVYRRGPYFFLIAAICYAYYLYTFLLVFAKRKSIERRNVIPLLVFPFLPMLGGLVQAAFYGVSVIWPSMTLSVLVVFITMQNAQINTDYLTELYNRRQLDTYCKKLNRKRRKATFVAGILLDIDDFKQINDRFGHIAGDQAIIYTAELLKQSIRPGVFAARYAGDEFIIFFEAKRTDELKEMVKRIRKNVKDFNCKAEVPYELSLSMGYDVLREGLSAEDFFKHLDELMFANKRQRKNT